MDAPAMTELELVKPLAGFGPELFSPPANLDGGGVLVSTSTGILAGGTWLVAMADAGALAPAASAGGTGLVPVRFAGPFVPPGVSVADTRLVWTALVVAEVSAGSEGSSGMLSRESEARWRPVLTS